MTSFRCFNFAEFSENAFSRAFTYKNMFNVVKSNKLKRACTCFYLAKDGRIVVKGFRVRDAKETIEYVHVRACKKC